MLIIFLPGSIAAVKNSTEVLVPLRELIILCVTVVVLWFVARVLVAVI
jgi:molybdopterin biosynthesis enzyme MoaB